MENDEGGGKLISWKVDKLIREEFVEYNVIITKYGITKPSTLNSKPFNEIE